jgi:hypothetical protein
LLRSARRSSVQRFSEFSHSRRRERDSPGGSNHNCSRVNVAGTPKLAGAALAHPLDRRFDDHAPGLHPERQMAVGNADSGHGASGLEYRLWRRRFFVNPSTSRRRSFGHAGRNLCSYRYRNLWDAEPHDNSNPDREVSEQITRLVQSPRENLGLCIVWCGFQRAHRGFGGVGQSGAHKNHSVTEGASFFVGKISFSAATMMKLMITSSIHEVILAGPTMAHLRAWFG